VIVEREVDCGALYDRERRALIELAKGLPAADLHRTVPATPAWSVHDVIAHLVGITADLNAQDFGDGDGDAWTARQVTRRRDRSVAELGAEWDEEAPTFTAGLALFGYELGSHYLGDLLQHVADVHHALGLPRRADDDQTLVVALDFYLDSFHQTLLDAAVGSVEVVTSSDRWLLGAGPTVASLSTGRFEAFRSLGGRRSEAQLRALAWTGDVDRVLGLVSRYGVPATGLEEP
jgi:uncharacterized protein (TIGR03083 family)